MSRAEALHSAERWAEALEMSEQALTVLPQSGSPEQSRLRLRVFDIAANSARRLGRREAALRHALEHQKELERLPKTEDYQEVRRVVALAIAEDSVGLGQTSVAADVLQQLRDGRYGTLKRREQLDVVVLQGTLEAARSQTDAAHPAWREAATLADQLLQNKPAFPQGDQIRFRKRQVIASEGLGEFELAGKQLEQLLAVLDKLPNPSAARREARYFFYLRASLRRDLPRAEQHLRRTLDEPSAKGASLSLADLHWELASLQRELGQRAEAEKSARRCLEVYEATLKAAVDRPEFANLRLACWRRLRLLYIEAGRLDDALRVTRQWHQLVLDRDGEKHLATVQSQSALAEVLAVRGEYDLALPLLRSVTAFWRDRPDEPLKLAEALNDLAAVERGVGQFHEALSDFAEALSLRQKHLAADHPDLATSYRNLASVSVSLGQFARAIELHQQVLEQCQKRGSRADGQRATTLLELAIAHKSQGELVSATERCRESLTLLESLLGPDHFALVAHHVALAGLARLTRHLDESQQCSETALRICQARGRERHELAAAAHLNLGMIFLQTNQWAAAEQHLQAARDIDVEGGRYAQAAQTWNRLGLLAHQRGDRDLSEQCFESALKLLASGRAKPQDRYNTLCNLAFVTRAKNPARAIELLEQAVEAAEAPRSDTFGAERERADFFARFASAFDLLVEWNLEDGQFANAFANAERSRNRTFLDQLRLVGVDLRTTLPPASQPLLDSESELLLRVQQLRSAAPTGRSSEELQQAQREYADVWRQIRNASPLYRDLLTQQQQLLTLDDLRDKWLRPDELMLFYYLGQSSGHVLMISPGDGEVRHVPLEVTSAAMTVLAQVAREQAAVKQTNAASKTDVRGPVGLVVSEKRTVSDDIEATPALAQGPLTRRQAASLVTWYLTEILQRHVGSEERGPAAIVKSEKQTMSPGSHTFLADLLLPPAVREEIARRKPRRVIVVPDGALHQLPFEALLLSDGKSPKYVLDEFPPLSYTPSANILANLRGRPEIQQDGSPKLLTVGNPQYSRSSGVTPNVAAVAPERRSEVIRDAFQSHGGSLQLLPNTQAECDRIATAFQRVTVTKLLGEDATERNVRNQLTQSRWIHLATHGLVDENHGNLFGSIALTPPTTGSNRDEDGFLSYNEILSLSLRGCDLAVLSACQTNIGPNRPLESGNSLAQAFLAAGARRVVASLWTVSDKSTSELIGRFFEEIAGPAEDSADYAKALQTARLRLRNDSGWSAPYFWAPFVLIGPE